MKKIQTSIAIFLLLASVAMHPTVFSAEPVKGENPAPKVFQKVELPVGGEFFQHPTNKQVVYYFINVYTLRQNKANTNKSPGIYHSGDAGQTWKHLRNEFTFKRFFVHPQSGELFAIIVDDSIYTDEAGFLTRGSFDVGKAIRSTNGTQWRDIMGKQQRVGGLNQIFVDPEHPHRVRLGGHSFRPYELIASDDEYSDWRRVPLPTGTPF